MQSNYISESQASLAQAGSWQTLLRRKAILIAFLLVPLCLFSEDYADGKIRLSLNEDTGRFSLYYINAGEEYVPFFSDRDPRTSFLGLMINNRTYRMGDAASFRMRFAGSPLRPALLFESPTIIIKEDFTFISTAGSLTVNGITITITVTNKGNKSVEAGIRYLIDTSLGEGGEVHFSTDKRLISGETETESGENFWISENSEFGIMGTAFGPDSTSGPDVVHFANWKRLNEVSWKSGVYQGRNFNLLPYSIGDSAVCYYFEPAVLEAGQSRTVSFSLAVKDEKGFAAAMTAGAEGTDSSRAAMLEDITALHEIAAAADRQMTDGTMDTEELAALELELSRLKTKYGQP
jgi:hypothetical protein